MKKMLIGGILSVVACTSLFAAMPQQNKKIIVIPYATYVNYSSGFNYKKVVGTNLQTNIQGNKLFMDLKYVYFDSIPTSKPHKWDMSFDYTWQKNQLPVAIDIGGKVTEYYYHNSHRPGQSIFAGIWQKKFNPMYNAKFGLRGYFTNLDNLIENQRAYQVDFVAISKPKQTSIGKTVIKNTLTYIKLHENNFDNKNHYWSDTISMISKKGKYVYMGEVNFGKAGYKIEADKNFAMDTSGSVSKWGILAGAGYKVNKKSMVIGKIKYSKIDTFVKNDVYETKFTVAYKMAF